MRTFKMLSLSLSLVPILAMSGEKNPDQIVNQVPKEMKLDAEQPESRIFDFTAYLVAPEKMRDEVLYNKDKDLYHGVATHAREVYITAKNKFMEFESSASRTIYIGNDIDRAGDEQFKACREMNQSAMEGSGKVVQVTASGLTLYQVFYGPLWVFRDEIYSLFKNYKIDLVTWTKNKKAHDIKFKGKVAYLVKEPELDLSWGQIRKIYEISLKKKVPRHWIGLNAGKNNVRCELVKEVPEKSDSSMKVDIGI